METKDGRVVLMEALAANPETSSEFQGLVDKIAPGSVAAARQGEAINRVIAAKLDDIDKVKNELVAEKNRFAVRNEIDMERRALLQTPFAREHGLTLEDMPEIEKVMLDKDLGITKHLTAAQWYVNARALGAPRGDAYEAGITMPRNDLGDYWKGTGAGRGITDGPTPRQAGDNWSRDRAHKDLRAISEGRPLDPAPFPIPEVDAKGYIVGGRQR